MTINSHGDSGAQRRSRSRQRPPVAAVVLFLLATLVVVASLHAEPSEAIEDALDTAREAAKGHRYKEVLAALVPLTETITSETYVYAVFAEIGRAYFHLGDYQQAHSAFVRAVTAHPRRIEAALYLQATSYLTGDHAQALTILREVLRSGAHDLYLAVSLPGERAFLSDPAVWEILEEHSLEVEVGARQGSFHGVRLGQERGTVERDLGTQGTDPELPVLGARAGPWLVWALGFDDKGKLESIVIHAEPLLKYTPYRLHFDLGFDWKVSPATAAAVLGPPEQTHHDVDGGVSMTWSMSTHKLTLGFGQPVSFPLPMLPADTAMLLTVRIQGLPVDPEPPPA